MSESTATFAVFVRLDLRRLDSAGTSLHDWNDSVQTVLEEALLAEEARGNLELLGMTGFAAGPVPSAATIEEEDRPYLVWEPVMRYVSRGN